MPRTLVVLALLVLAACADSRDGGASTSSASAEGRPRPSGPRINTSAAPITSAEPSQPPIRQSPGPGPLVDGAALEVRAFVTRITTNDPLHLAIQLVSDQPIKDGHPFLSESVAFDEMLASLTYEALPLVGDGKNVSGRKGPDKGQRTLADTMFDVTLAEKPAKDDTLTIAAQGAFAKPGKHTLTVRATIKTDKRTLKLTSAPLEIQVVEPSSDVRSIEDLTQVAADLVKNRRGLEARPTPTAPVIEDRDGNVSFRFQVRPTEAGGYDVEVVEVLLDRSGKLVFYDPFRHFTCVAKGTLVDVPGGRAPIETLRVGMRVTSWDTDRREPAVSVVEAVDSAYAERLVALGDLLVTPNHPVLAGGSWQDAGNIDASTELFGRDFSALRVEPRRVDGPATVYDITVSYPHTFFAGGVLVHNKAAANPVGGRGQPWDGWFFRRSATTK
jgi:hypothetical protein